MKSQTEILIAKLQDENLHLLKWNKELEKMLADKSQHIIDIEKSFMIQLKDAQKYFQQKEKKNLRLLKIQTKSEMFEK